MNIFNICSEANPYIKTGGLADVAYSLPKEIAKGRNRVSVILPYYQAIKNKNYQFEKIGSVEVSLSWRHQIANIYYEKRDNINFYFLENQYYFERENIYGYDDDGERFAFFSLAAVETIKKLKEKPAIIHLHDWQAAMVACLVREQNGAYFNNTKTVLTIHNAAFLGYLDRMALGNLYNLPDSLFTSGKARMNDRVSTLKTGIVYANKITAVSPTNRNELLTPEGGNGLDSVLRLREFDFKGIVNGIDYDEFNPENDKYIKHQYNCENVMAKKLLNKKDLCQKFGLSNYKAPLFGLVSRITWQKGVDLVFEAIHHIAIRGGNVILLGSGEKDSENTMNWLHSIYPDQVAVYIGYNNQLAHEIYAASDFFLMPSLFEPCGLGQLIAERYGTLPIVRRTGGLKDTVINYDGNNIDVSNGFGFDAFSSYEMNRTCIYALETIKNKKDHEKLVINAMTTDNSWKKSSKQYVELYKEITK